MLRTPNEDIPEWIEVKILYSLDFASLLTARAVCQRWNQIIQPLVAHHGILNIHMDKSLASKRFRRGKWNGNITPPFQEIRIIPKPENAFWLTTTISRYTSALKYFIHVRKLTLFDNGSVLHFIHRYMIELPSVRYVQIRERKFESEEKCQVSRYYNVGHAYSLVIGQYKSWLRALDHLCRIETLRIRLFDRTSALVYMQLFTFRTNMLAHIELDFSKCLGLPFSRSQTNEIFSTLTDILECCYLTLRQFRLKWAVRVDCDLDFIKSDDDIEPFFEFLLCLRNPVWTKLTLHQLTLNFPTINLGLGLCEASLFPFLQKQKTSLKRAVFGRVLPNEGVEMFAARFPSPTIQKFEFYFYFSEFTLAAQPVSHIRGLELMLFENSNVDINELSRLQRETSKNFGKQCFQLKLIHSHFSHSYVKPDVDRIINHFQNIKVLELLDTSLYGKLFVHFTSTDFNSLVENLEKLVSLKMSNAGKLTDSGLTLIPQQQISYMHRVGAYYWDGTVTAPVTRAQELRYLDLRDLTGDLSDAVVYLAFQHIKKLEKIAFHGTHNITTWGKQVLETKFKRNPFFDVILKTYDDDYVTFGNYTMPCADFP